MLSGVVGVCFLVRVVGMCFLDGCIWCELSIWHEPKISYY